MTSAKSPTTGPDDEAAAATPTLTAFQSLVRASTEGALHGRLDALVVDVAVQLMPASSSTLTSYLTGALRILHDFFGVDACFLRRNDHERGLSVLVAEWPNREVIPDPDPLGEVPFESDPVFSASRQLREPLIIRPTAEPDAYQERMQDAAGIDAVSMACVPLIDDGTTGVLGFVKFGDRPWDAAEQGALQAIASIIVQVQARAAAEQRLQHLAFHDVLTGLPNRRALLDRLHARVEFPTTILFADVDDFKVMNDLGGHAIGDDLLRNIAANLEEIDDAFVARLGGDEFVVVLEGDDAVAAVATATSICERVAEPLHRAGHEISRTASVGVAVGPGGDELLRRADLALHRAKSLGSGQIVLFDDALDASVQARMNLEIELRAAIAGGELRLHYQPEIDLLSGRILAVEALVRWEHPTRGLLPAGTFIQVAEESGLIADLGKWVLPEACRQLAEWRVVHPHRHITMRVNISPAQLGSTDVVDQVAAALEQNDLPGRLLCLEITEHAMMQDVDAAMRTLHELKDLGVQLAIDDFGIGFSSMSQLKRLPVDVLKIDYAFVSGLTTDNGDRAIVEASVQLARAFGLETVAEGVEEADVIPELLKLGCNRAQGFLLCRPQAPAQLEEMIALGYLPGDLGLRRAPLQDGASAT